MKQTVRSQAQQTNVVNLLEFNTEHALKIGGISTNRKG